MARRLLVFTACAVGLLSTVGAALPYPILSPLFADGQINGLNHFAGLPPKFLLGLALAINPLGMLIGSALLGPISDRYGRRLTLLSTILFSAIGHLATVLALFSEHYLLFLLARFVTGLAEGNSSVMSALLADELEGEQRVQAFAWLNGSSYSGWLLGPLIAGATVQFGTSVPFMIAAGILFSTFLLGLFTFPSQASSHSNGNFWHNLSQRHSFTLLRYRPLRELFIIHLAYTCGVTAFYEFFPLWLVEFLKMKALGISLVSGTLCAVMTCTSAIVGHGLVVTAGPKHLRRYAFMVAACITLTALLGPLGGCAALIAFGVPHALYNTILPVYCSERFANYGHGAVMGLISTTFCIANVVVALIGSGVTLIDTRLILLLGACSSAWAGWRIALWATQSADGKSVFEKQVNA
jgi:DHA1 family tetracycline resistance protein-like MFS transporter